MADQSIALQVQPVNFDLASPLINAEKIINARQQNQEGGMKIGAESIDYQNELIRNAAAHSLDADSWDQAMQDAAKRGAPAAQQYVGRYTPLLQQRLFESYSGGPQGQPASSGVSPLATAGGAAPAAGGGGSPVGPASLDYQFKNVPPEQMQASLKKLDLVSNALQGVRDQQTWDQTIQSLAAQGIPEAQSFAGPYSPLRVQQLWSQIQPVRSYLQSRVANASLGLPAPPVGRNLIKTDAGIFEADPYAAPGTPATMIGRTPSYERTNAVDKFGQPILADKFSGQTISGPGGGANGPGASGAVPLSDAAARIHAAENATGNRSATNPNSSATGNGQFINSTWLSTVKAARPELAGLSDGDLLKLRQDPAFSQEMTQEYARQNGSTLQQQGYPVTTATLALSHRFGTDGGIKIMQAPPNTPIEDVVSPAVMKANPDLKDQTTTSVMQGFTQKVGNTPVDMGNGGQGGVQTLSPEERSLQEKILPEQFEKAKESFDSATGLQLQLGQMQEQLQQLGTTGFLAPGTGDSERLAYAKKANSLAKIAGVKDADLPFDANKVASGEDIQKGTTRLGFDLARQLGSREAMMIVQQAVGAVPGIENTPRGARLIFGALNTAAQRQVDYYNFLSDWAQHNPNTMGADVAFNKAYPVGRYTNQALLAAVPPAKIALLKANPNKASDFDKMFGSGLSKVILGQQQ